MSSNICLLLLLLLRKQKKKLQRGKSAYTRNGTLCDDDNKNGNNDDYKQANIEPQGRVMHEVVLLHPLICDLIKNSINHQTYHPVPFLLYPFARSQLFSDPPVTFGAGTLVEVAVAGESGIRTSEFPHESEFRS